MGAEFTRALRQLDVHPKMRYGQAEIMWQLDTAAAALAKAKDALEQVADKEALYDSITDTLLPAVVRAIVAVEHEALILSKMPTWEAGDEA